MLASSKAMGSLMMIVCSKSHPSIHSSIHPFIHPSRDHQPFEFLNCDFAGVYQKLLEIAAMGKVLTTVCEVEAFPRTVLGGGELGGVGGLSQPGWVNGHGPCGI